MADINKEELIRLANLARIELNPEEEERFLKDFEGILKYFDHLKELSPRPDYRVEGKKVLLREDSELMSDHFSDSSSIIKEFPEEKDNMNKIPPVFK